MSYLLQLLSEQDEESAPASHFYILDDVSSIGVEELLDTDLHDHIRIYPEIVRDVICNSRTFRASPEQPFGNVSLVDLVPCVLYGCSVPVVIHNQVPADGGDCWKLIGESYMDGIMDGEILEVCKSSYVKITAEKFELR
jgi:hypothetical protein